MTCINAITPNTNPDLVAVIGDQTLPVVGFLLDPSTGAVLAMTPTGQTIRVIDIEGAQVVSRFDVRAEAFRDLTTARRGSR